MKINGETVLREPLEIAFGVLNGTLHRQMLETGLITVDEWNAQIAPRLKAVTDVMLGSPVHARTYRVHESLYPQRGRAVSDIAAERRRQIDEEGWNAKHDDEHGNGGLALAAACYASAAAAFAANHGKGAYAELPQPFRWPWQAKWWKPKDPRRDLVRAAALIAAEIDRLDRQTKKETS